MKQEYSFNDQLPPTIVIFFAPASSTQPIILLFRVPGSSLFSIDTTSANVSEVRNLWQQKAKNAPPPMPKVQQLRRGV